MSHSKEPGSREILIHNELSKILCSFDLTMVERNRIKKSILNKESLEIDEIKWELLKPLKESTKINIGYHLYSIGILLFDEVELKKKMITYLGLLDFSSSEILNTVLREIENSYNGVIEEQHKIHVIGSNIIKQMKIPHIDVEEIMRKGNIISRYDPYMVRRKKIQGQASKAAKITIQKLCRRYPQLAMFGSAEAASQLNLSNDGVAEEVESLMKEWWGDSKRAAYVVESALDIQKETRDFMADL